VVLGFYKGGSEVWDSYIYKPAFRFMSIVDLIVHKFGLDQFCKKACKKVHKSGKIVIVNINYSPSSFRHHPKTRHRCHRICWLCHNDDRRCQP
jgi:hypothetical protein